ncbi:MAG: hypothetical protein B7Z58_07180 [Acidiphilium sp. 37-64-53]|nr:EAL domain-containing protein [Acidiphilium sp. 37-64-53]OYW02638.1 MAG: hypothetical protein B7Z58_07180 [Acidiphilium sp. 37-64-53]
MAFQPIVDIVRQEIFAYEALVRGPNGENAGSVIKAVTDEITEGEAVTDPAHLARIVTAYRAMGFRTAIDDFGAGHSNLNLLAQFRPDIIKLDMVLIRDIDRDKVRQSLVRHCVGLCDDLGILMVAEGIETLAEYQTLRGLGVKFIQGYLLAKPGWRRLPEAQFTDFTTV